MPGELLPVLSGLLLGLVLSVCPPARRRPVGTLLAVALGLYATVVSGEFRLSWAFVLVDVPLVAVSSLVAFWLTQRVLIRRRPR
ncbi:hypothetical protein [Deinococcus budaensis]|uniref:Uncharacterized protein n=1 Tax=Deinococcus budaensis TaxID=1665626 RepID=A0A7W8GET0_9DEIO|nr:hypothetical protein [Deinococcus budaensis]MBB5233978.1 hypothetical protein [Deinococcus budaensis]